MRPVSPEFLASLRSSYLVSSFCSLSFPGNPTPVEVPIQSGMITIDRTADNRRSGSIVIPWSLEQGETLGVDLRTLPLGGYSTLRCGLRYADGTVEQAQLGVLRVEAVTWATLEHSATIELADRMAQVRDEPFVSPYAAGGKKAGDAAIEIVQAVFADTIGYTKLVDPPTILADVFYSGSRTEALTALEQSGNAETYFDANGDFVYAPKPSGDPVWTVDAGESGVMINASEHLDRTGIYNGVYVEGQNTAVDAPVSALATYTDPTSPIRWGGPFGKVAIISQSTSVQDATQAATVAQSLLNLRLQMTRSLTLTSAPNPALEAGDIIRVVFPDGRVEQHLVDAVTVDLATGAQTIGTRDKFTPQAQATLTPKRHRVYWGAEMWRQLRDAKVVVA